MLDLSSINDMWRAFGWNVKDIDGHDVGQIVHAVETAKRETSKPTAIIARTVKGKGVSYMENNDHYHGNPPENEEKYKAAISELQARIDELDKRISSLGGSPLEVC